MSKGRESYEQPEPLTLSHPSVELDLRVEEGEPLLLEDAPSEDEQTTHAPHPPAPGGDAEALPQSIGRYYLLRELARGANGRVVCAIDQELGREVAVKLLLPAFVHHKDAVARFLSEARINARLEHPNVVPVHDSGVTPQGVPFFVMRLVRGRSLGQIFSALRRQDPDVRREFTRARLLQLFLRLCMGVAYAHSKGILHRDLKPANVMLGEFGEVHVMDWGLAKDRAGVSVPSLISAAYSSAFYDPNLSIEGKVFGTPLYMAPEQARGQLSEIDERSDVYALGAILYECLTYQPTYPLRGVEEVLHAVLHKRITSPRERAPERDIPEALEEICLRALAKNKDERYPSARALHDEVEAFLEGTKDRERNEREAEQKVFQGIAQRAHYEAIAQRAARLAQQRDELRAKTPRSAPESVKQPLWEVERRLVQAKADELRAFGATIDAFQQALGFVHDQPDARSHLADLFAARLRQAEHEHNPERAAHYEAQVKRFDDGKYTALWEGTGLLRIQTQPPGARATLQAIVDREVVASFGTQIPLGQTPLQSHLRAGEYLVELELSGYTRVALSLRLARNATLSLSVPLLRPDQLPPGFVYVPGGPAWLGGDPLAPSRAPWREENIPGFLLARYPVTMAEYLEFLNSLAQRDPEEADRRVPRATANAGHYWPKGDDGRYTLPGADPDGDIHHPRYPVVAVSHDDALAFCEWRSQRDGTRYRLPGEFEWEKAGRGADGRFFPWGDLFDPAFCHMQDSRSRRGLEPVGSFSRDISPYGVRDMAGTVAEWCADWFDEEANLRALRGGAWLRPEQNCRLAARGGERPHVVSGSCGFRLACDLPPLE
jgi:serine/threonine-protein kinase